MMKNIKKMLCAAAIIAAFGMNAFAQQDNPTDDIKARAEVRVLINVTGAQDLEFQNVQVGEAKTVNTRDEVTAGTSSGDEKSGRFDITKGASTDVKVEFTTLPPSLAGPGEATLPINFDGEAFGRLNLTPILTGGIDFNPTSAINTPNDGGTVDFFNATAFSVFLGGTVTPEAEQVVGTYDADVTLTVSYN